MKQAIVILLAVLLCGSVFAAGASSSEEVSVMKDLVGQKIIVDYETGYLFQVEYLSESRLKWTSLKERTDGEPMTGEETYYAYKYREGLYGVNWIEATGIVVSQTLDFTDGKVYAFMTWKDDSERGGRGHLLHKGSLKVVK